MYPIAPVEVQAYAWAALMHWAEYFVDSDPEFARALQERAATLKKKFNESFVLKGPRSVTLAFALDGNGKKLSAPRSSMGHVLWAAHKGESILNAEFVEPLRKRLLSRDLFVPKAGIRTLSSRSLNFDPQSYHNGSIWPHDTAMLAEGLRNFGYLDDAKRVREALINAYTHFQTPIELFAYHKGLREYETSNGHRACRVQAWSAASLLAVLE
jgi:glycogen debranching enzyme